MQYYKMDDQSPNPSSIPQIFLPLLVISCAIITYDFYSNLRYAFQIFIYFLSNVWEILSHKGKTMNSSSSSSAKVPRKKICQSKKVKIAKGNGRGKSLMHKVCNISPNIDDEEEDDKRLHMEEVKEMMERLEGLLCDDNGAGEISELFEEEVRGEEVKEAFDVFDENNDGFLDAGEIKRALCALGFLEASALDCQKMIKAFDKNGDGLVDFKEFVELMVQSFSN